MDERKGAIIDALIAKTNALLDTHLKTSTEDIPRILRQGIEAILEEKKVGTFEIFSVWILSFIIFFSYVQGCKFGTRHDDIREAENDEIV